MRIHTTDGILPALMRVGLYSMVLFGGDHAADRSGTLGFHGNTVRIAIAKVVLHGHELACICILENRIAFGNRQSILSATSRLVGRASKVFYIANEQV